MAISSALPCSLLVAALMLLASVVQVQGITRRYDFNVRRRSIERTTCLCAMHASDYTNAVCICLRSATLDREKKSICIHATYLCIKCMEA